MRSPKRLSSPGRRSPLKSPSRKYADYTIDTEINRALARELYVESTVNVVNPSNRRTSGKVKPGQMNLFNPKGQKIDASPLTYAVVDGDNGEKRYASPTRANYRSKIDEIS